MSLAWQPPQLDVENRLITITTADGSVSLAFDVTLEAEGQTLGLEHAMLTEAEGLKLSLAYEQPSLEWDVTLSRAESDTALVISSVIRNRGANPVRLGKCSLVAVSPERGQVAISGDDGNAVHLACSGTTGHTVVARADDAAKAMSRTLLHLVSAAAGRTLNCSFATFDHMETIHRFDYGAEGLRALNCVCDFQDHLLPPGAEIATETLVIEASADDRESLHHWADRAAAHYRPAIWPKIPGGWLGWSWVDAFNIENYEETVLRNCQAIRERLAGFDIEYVWVSIGNIKDGMPGNWLDWDYTNFPGGPEHLVSELGKLDFKLGLWCGAFWVCGGSHKLEELIDNTLRREGQPAVALPHWNYGASARLPLDQRPPIYSLDPTQPKARDFIANVFETYRQWGIRYYMIDFINAIAYPNEGVAYDEHYDKSVIRGAQMLREGLKIVREAAGPETYLLSSSGPTMQNVGLMDACRVGNDYGEGRAINPESYFYPGTFVINKPDFWTSHRWASDNMAGTYFTHRKLYLNDSGNVLTLDKPIPLSESQITATIFGIGGGPAMLGDDIGRISDERLALIKKVFPRTSHVATPVDLFDRPHPDYPRLFHNHVEAEWGAWEVVSVLNYDDEPLDLTVPLEKLGLTPDDQYLLWEFWNEQYLGVCSGSLRALVPPRSARVYRLYAQTGHPWIAGTDMHVMQGEVELSGVQWDHATLTLRGQVTRPSGNTGNVFIHVPKGMAILNPQGYHIGKDGNEECLVVSRQFEFSDEAQEFVVTFGRV